MNSVECHHHALMCSVSVVFIDTMEDDQRLNTLVHEGDPLYTFQKTTTKFLFSFLTLST